MELAAGLRASLRVVVSEADTAIAAGSGDVPVLATPRLLALAEAASVAAIGPHLAAEMTSVGTAVSLEHRRASPVGAEIVVEAELTEADGRRLVFSFIVRHSQPGSGTGGDGGPDDAGQGTSGSGPGAEEDLVVGAGTLERVVVDRDKFLAHAALS
jgi:fluoroacetyl-CoA thioesterase